MYNTRDDPYIMKPQPHLRQGDLGLSFSPGTLPKILLQVPAGDSPSDTAHKNAPLELVPTEAPVVQELMPFTGKSCESAEWQPLLPMMEVVPSLSLESGQ